MNLSKHTALMIIDAQEGIKEELHWGGNRNNPGAEKNISTLLDHWRKFNLPVIVVQHCSVALSSPFRPDRPGNKLMDFLQVRQSDKLVKKSTASAFIKTDLFDYVVQEKIDGLIVTGFVTNNSVEATARSAGDSGINTTVVSDATACFDKVAITGKKFTSDDVHQLSLANLKDEYADIKTTEEILSALQSLAPNLKSTI
ncbi:MAG TPA: isochorismatase family protein [Chryseolinea sp.]|nr:isochorismatase family protein [Chryseolinea sp.]